MDWYREGTAESGNGLIPITIPASQCACHFVPQGNSPTTGTVTDHPFSDLP